MTDLQSNATIAIIGTSGRFPGADSPAELWSNLAEGRIGLRAVTDEELVAAGADPAMTSHPHYVRVAAPIDGVDQFDPSAFGFTPREAEISDPQHRLFIECAWQAVEAAGYQPTAVPGDVGVFAGCGLPTYMTNNAARVADEPGGALQLWVGNERDSLTSWVSYKFDFRGPSIDVQSFCSTSLVAIHLAVQSLLTYECDVALAGGVFVDLAQPRGYLFEEGGIASPDGVVRSFDAGAQGTVMGNGAGVVVLKRLGEALADHDQVQAVILGSAVNNDGRARVGYTAPGVDGEAAVVEAALQVAGVPPETVGYIECHATGTMLGDSIELAALSRVFPSRPGNACVLGSLKPSLGHLDRASGVAGLIRAVEALRHQVLPGTPNYRTPNRALATDRFRVLPAAEPWPAGRTPRRAGVTSFGLGGTNAHVVLQEAPVPARGEAPAGPQVLIWSARTEAALEAATEDLRRHLDTHRDLRLDDVSFTLQQSRAGFPLRRAVVVHSLDDAVDALKDTGRWIDGQTRQSDPAVRLPAFPTTSPQLEVLAEAVAWLPVTSEAPLPTDPRAAVDRLVDVLTRLGVRVVAGAETGAVVEVEPPTGTEAGPDWLLRQLALLWQAGVPVDWALLHTEPVRVELPTYPFQRQRCWIQPDRPRSDSARDLDLAPVEWTNLPTWRRRPLLTSATDDALRAAGPWLVYAAEECGEALVRRLREAGAAVSVARPGDGFAERDGEFVLRPDERRDHELLLGRLSAAPQTIVHAFSLGAARSSAWERAFAAQQDAGFYSILALVDVLARRTDGPPVKLTLLTAGAVAVTGPEVANPQAATLPGLAPTLAQENPGLSCGTIDVDPDPADRRADLAGLARQILPEAAGGAAGPVAFRRGERWIRGFDRLPLPDPRRPALPDGATVLITGGLGDVGMIISRHLAATRKCRLVLTAHSRLPARQDWARFLDTRGGRADRSTRHVRNILALERAGAEVLAVSADVADPEAMERVVESARKRFGTVDAVIHGAGLSDAQYFGTAHELDREACEGHFRAKVHGFHALQQVLTESEATLRLTLSSLSAVLGGIRLGPYASANAALDAYALDARQRGAGSWLTIDWDTWRTREDGPNQLGGAAVEMAPEQGIEVLERAMSSASAVGHLVISTRPIEDRVAQWVAGTGRADTGTDGGADRARYPRPVLTTPYVEPVDAAEQGLAGTWAAVLGLDRVGAEDNFFELGGNSLIAMQLMGRVRQDLRAIGPVTAVLEYPTVRELAGVLQFPGPATSPGSQRRERKDDEA